MVLIPVYNAIYFRLQSAQTHEKRVDGHASSIYFIFRHTGCGLTFVWLWLLNPACYQLRHVWTEEVFDAFGAVTSTRMNHHKQLP
jgi:hypothetical protein